MPSRCAVRNVSSSVNRNTFSDSGPTLGSERQPGCRLLAMLFRETLEQEAVQLAVPARERELEEDSVLRTVLSVSDTDHGHGVLLLCDCAVDRCSDERADRPIEQRTGDCAAVIPGPGGRNRAALEHASEYHRFG
jgi:hypothetical protein